MALPALLGGIGAALGGAGSLAGAIGSLFGGGDRLKIVAPSWDYTAQEKARIESETAAINNLFGFASSRQTALANILSQQNETMRLSAAVESSERQLLIVLGVALGAFLLLRKGR